MRAEIAAVLVVLALLGLPERARAQSAQSDFVRAVAGLRIAMRGAYGDEGPDLLRRLDEVSAALAEWDRSIELDVARLRPRVASAAGGEGADLRVELGLLYLQRSRFAEALLEFNAAGRLTPERAAIPLLRGLVLERLERRDAAGAAFLEAWRLDPADPVTAYLARTRSTGVSAPAGTDLARLNESLLIAARDTVRRVRSRRGSAFFDMSLGVDAPDATPVFPLARYAGGFALYAGGRYEEAIARWRQAATGDPLVTDPAVSVPGIADGIIAFRQGRLAAAMVAMDASTTARKPSAEAHRARATVLGVAGYRARSVAELQAALRLRPDDERSWIALALSADAGVPENAVQTLEAAVKAVPDSAELHWRLAGSLVKVERNAAALDHYAQAARLGAIAGQGQVDQFEAALATMHLDAARTASVFERRVRGHLNDAGAHRDLANAYAKQDRQDEAFAELAIAAWLDPADAQTLVALGHAHLAARRDSDAVEAFQEAVRIAPEMREARYALAQALTRLGRRDESLQHLSEFERLRREAAERALRDDELAEMKAEAQRHARAGQYRLAAQTWMKIVVLEPQVARNHVDLAEAMVGAGQLAASVQHFVKAADMEGISDIHLRLSEVLAKLGRNRESGLARETYERLQVEDFKRRLTIP